MLSDPNWEVNFTKHERPKAASHAPNVRRISTIKDDLQRVKIIMVRISAPASKNRRAIKRWVRWKQRPISIIINRIGRRLGMNRFISKGGKGPRRRFTRPIL